MLLTDNSALEHSPDMMSHDEASVIHLAAAVRSNPAQLAHVQALADQAGMSPEHLSAALQSAYHVTPEAWLMRARIAHAQYALLHSSASLAAIAADAGFEHGETFAQHFQRATAMTPADYRRLRETTTFTLALPADYPLARILRHLGRDAGSLTDRVAATRWITGVRTGAGSGAVVETELTSTSASCRVLAPEAVGAGAMSRIHAHVLAGLGLAADPAPFETLAARLPEGARLIEGQRGLRMPLIGDYFDGLTWSIVGQQISLPFAYTLRRRLTERAGTHLGGGIWLPATPQQAAELDENELTAMSFSRAKASYLLGVARAVLAGALPLDDLAHLPAPLVERTLLAQRGIGPWSANYVMMRSYGFQDCVPLGDAGLNASLQRFYALPARPDRTQTLELMEPFRPYRSLATFHFWQRASVQ
jgi:AraC family transcriptional regulator of adaptative response / DNA-3-methyladenine glycosylase II